MAAVASALGDGAFKEGASHEDWKNLSEGVGRVSLADDASEANDCPEGTEKFGNRGSDDEDKRILDLLEMFFSMPEFTDAVRDFIEANEHNFVFVEEGEEQPLSNYDLYLKYTKLIEDQLEAFLKQHGIDHEDIAKLCVAEKEGGNKVSFSLDYIIASTQYDKFVQMMEDFKTLHEFEIGEDCLYGWGLDDADGQEQEGVQADA